jgi:hypothetical protein
LHQKDNEKDYKAIKKEIEENKIVIKQIKDLVNTIVDKINQKDIDRDKILSTLEEITQKIALIN